MRTEIKSLPKMCLFDVLKMNGIDGCDICDDAYDWGTYIGVPESWEKCSDYYDRCMLLFALNMTCVQYRPNGYTICDVAGFIWDNKEPFTKFLNQENRKEYKPSTYKDETIDPEVDGVFYDVYMESFESLLIGNYSESDYRKLYKYLTEWNYWKKIKRLIPKNGLSGFMSSNVYDAEISDDVLFVRVDFSKDEEMSCSRTALSRMYDVKLNPTDWIVLKYKTSDWDYLGAFVVNDEGRDIRINGMLPETIGLHISVFTNPCVVQLMQDAGYKNELTTILENLGVYNKEENI